MIRAVRDNVVECDRQRCFPVVIADQRADGGGVMYEQPTQLQRGDVECDRNAVQPDRLLDR